MPIPTGTEICPVPDNYLKLSGVNVKFMASSKSYVTAEADCRKNHGYLAKISSQQELRALQFLKGEYRETSIITWAG